MHESTQSHDNDMPTQLIYPEFKTYSPAQNISDETAIMTIGATPGGEADIRTQENDMTALYDRLLIASPAPVRVATNRVEKNALHNTTVRVGALVGIAAFSLIALRLADNKEPQTAIQPVATTTTLRPATTLAPVPTTIFVQAIPETTLPKPTTTLPPTTSTVAPSQRNPIDLLPEEARIAIQEARDRVAELRQSTPTTTAVPRTTTTITPVAATAPTTPTTITSRF